MKELLNHDNEKHDVIQQEVCRRMMERLGLFKINPAVVLDLSCRFGLSTKLLKAHFKKSFVIGIEQSPQFFSVAKSKKTWLKPFTLMQANFMQLPFADESVDFIFAHQLIESAEVLTLLFQECFRVLKPQGCFIFSTLGPDTFKELKSNTSFGFMDMHDVGDILLKQGFLDPVMDREDVILNYPNPAFLYSALQAQGWNLPKELSSQQVTYELIFGQAWRGQKKPGNAQEQKISIAQIKNRLANH